MIEICYFKVSIFFLKITKEFFDQKKKTYIKVFKALNFFEKKKKKTIDDLEAKITELEFENREIINKIREKEKVIFLDFYLFYF